MKKKLGAKIAPTGANIYSYLFFIRSQQAILPECLWFSTQSFNSIEALTTSLPYPVRNCFLFILFFLAFAMKLDRVDVTFSGILPVLRYSIVWSYSSSFISSTCEFEELREYNYFFFGVVCIHWTRWTYLWTFFVFQWREFTKFIFFLFWKKPHLFFFFSWHVSTHAHIHKF